MTPVVVSAPSPVLRGRPERPALAPDANAHAAVGRPWSVESREAALADARRWREEYRRAPRCRTCLSWEFAGPHVCLPIGGAT